MTEFWVSQGNKWCEYCRIYYANNPTSIRNHEAGVKHKESVNLRLSRIRKESADQEKEKAEATRLISRIEEKARKQYEKDLLHQQQQAAGSALPPPAPAGPPPEKPAQQLPAPEPQAAGATAAQGWVQDESTGYFHDASTGYHYDPNSGLYYTDLLERWTTQAEAIEASNTAAAAAAQPVEPRPAATAGAGRTTPPAKVAPSGGPPGASPAASGSSSRQPAATAGAAKTIRSGSSRPGVKQPMRGVESSFAVDTSKRKREQKPSGPVSAAEAAALQAREAARQRTAERDKAQKGLYSAWQP